MAGLWNQQDPNEVLHNVNAEPTSRALPSQRKGRSLWTEVGKVGLLSTFYDVLVTELSGEW